MQSRCPRRPAEAGRENPGNTYKAGTFHRAVIHSHRMSSCKVFLAFLALLPALGCGVKGDPIPYVEMRDREEAAAKPAESPPAKTEKRR